MFKSIFLAVIVFSGSLSASESIELKNHETEKFSVFQEDLIISDEGIFLISSDEPISLKTIRSDKEGLYFFSSDFSDNCFEKRLFVWECKNCGYTNGSFMNFNCRNCGRPYPGD